MTCAKLSTRKIFLRNCAFEWWKKLNGAAFEIPLKWSLVEQRTSYLVLSSLCSSFFSFQLQWWTVFFTGYSAFLDFRRSAVQNSEAGKEKGKENEEGVTCVRAWPHTCVHGRRRTTQDHENTTRERTGRSKVATLLSHQLPALAAEEECRASGTVLTGWVFNPYILYDGTIIKPTYNSSSKSCCIKKIWSTWPWFVPRAVWRHTKSSSVPAGKKEKLNCLHTSICLYSFFILIFSLSHSAWFLFL